MPQHLQLRRQFMSLAKAHGAGHHNSRRGLRNVTDVTSEPIFQVKLACVATAAAALGLAFAAPANAETTGTVKAQTTQRMNGPNLNSGQDGVYKSGQVLTLVCHTTGEPVKGYFSFNIPNGGWDNLWYKTSDNHYVADVDIETHTLNALGSDCNQGEQQAAPAPAAQSGELRWPLDSVNVVQEFGANPASYQPKGHDGIDLAAATGTPVHAAADGTVAFEGYGQNNSWMTEMAGICILLRHSNIHTGYAHLSRTVINDGQHVTKGQLIGYSGSTGEATGPHLHFEVLPLNPDFKNGYNGRIDPHPYVA
jgi:murein DD-endopeptidase MepM/ murein hydrolase activator NlpD